jgi:hypothetical protein
MIVAELEEALVEFIAQNTTELVRFKSNEHTDEFVPPQVYRGFVGRDQVGALIPGDITKYPAVVVRAKMGVQAVDYEDVTVELIIGTFDDSLDQQGYLDCMNIVERIKGRLREMSVIRTRFPIRLPLNWQINKAVNVGSYYFAEMQVDFHVPVAATQYDATTMTPDLMEGKYNAGMYVEYEHTT